MLDHLDKKLPLQPAKSEMWLFAHFLPFYPHCRISNYNKPSIAIYYGGCGGCIGGVGGCGDGFGSGGGSGCGGGGGGCGGGRVMVVA